MNQATSEEIKSLSRVLSVTDVRSLNSDHLKHGLEDGRPDVSLCRQTDNDDGTSWSDVFSGLLEWLLIDSNEDDGVWAEAILGSGSHILSDVTRGGEVDEGLMVC